MNGQTGETPESYDDVTLMTSYDNTGNRMVWAQVLAKKLILNYAGNINQPVACRRQKCMAKETEV